jgi:hypothetical protein
MDANDLLRELLDLSPDAMDALADMADGAIEAIHATARSDDLTLDALEYYTFLRDALRATAEERRRRGL